MESSLCCKIRENTKTSKHLEKAWIHIFVCGWRIERDKRFTIRSVSVDPKIYQAGNYQSIHHPVKLGHRSIIDVQARLTKCGGLSHKFKSRIQHSSLSAHTYCRDPVNSRKSARLRGCCYFCSNWATHTKAGSSSSGRPRWYCPTFEESRRSCMSLHWEPQTIVSPSSP